MCTQLNVQSEQRCSFESVLTNLSHSCANVCIYSIASCAKLRFLHSFYQEKGDDSPTWNPVRSCSSSKWYGSRKMMVDLSSSSSSHQASAFAAANCMIRSQAGGMRACQDKNEFKSKRSSRGTRSSPKSGSMMLSKGSCSWRGKGLDGQKEGEFVSNGGLRQFRFFFGPLLKFSTIRNAELIKTMVLNVYW